MSKMNKTYGTEFEWNYEKKKEGKIHRMYSHFIAFQHQIYEYTKMVTGESKNHLYSFTTKVKRNIFVIALKYTSKSNQ